MPEDTVATEIADRLIEFYVRRDDACRRADWPEARHLQKQIEETVVERNKLFAGSHESKCDE